MKAGARARAGTKRRRTAKGRVRERIRERTIRNPVIGADPWTIPSGGSMRLYVAAAR
jgi:hypothetical protein